MRVDWLERGRVAVVVVVVVVLACLGRSLPSRFLYAGSWERLIFEHPDETTIYRVTPPDLLAVVAMFFSREIFAWSPAGDRGFLFGP